MVLAVAQDTGEAIESIKSRTPKCHIARWAVEHCLLVRLWVLVRRRQQRLEVGLLLRLMNTTIAPHHPSIMAKEETEDMVRVMAATDMGTTRCRRPKNELNLAHSTIEMGLASVVMVLVSWVVVQKTVLLPLL